MFVDVDGPPKQLIFLVKTLSVLESLALALVMTIFWASRRLGSPVLWGNLFNSGKRLDSDSELR